MSISNFRQYAQRGFTLVELLIVVIILAILAAIVVPQFSSSTDDAKLSALDANLAAMRSAITLYKQQHDGHYPGVPAASGGTCPTGGTAGTGDAGSAEAFAAQLTMYTNAVGQACSAKDDTFKFGPYLKNLPNDPIKDISTVVLSTAGALTPAANGTNGGWLFDTVSGRIINNNSSTIGTSTKKYSDR